jgi:rhomboid protease GluP
MPGMASGDEVVSPPTDRPEASPNGPGEPPGARPTPEAVLGWIAKAGGRPWFPSRHAAETATDRDALDEPLDRLRAAGLVRIAEWERGTGQGYVLTAEGQLALAGAVALPPTGGETVTSPRSAPPPRGPADDGPEPRPSVVVPVLLAANLVWFIAGLVLVLRGGLPAWTYLAEGNAEVLHRLGAVNGLDLLRGEWWRLATSCFVHIGAPHLLLNLFALIVVGPLAESLWGRGRFLIIYALSGLAGSCLAMALRPEVLLAGASGAIWGLLMSLVTWLVLYRHTLAPEEAADSTRRLTVVIVLNVMFSLVPGISWQAHLGGGLAGFVAAGLLNTLQSGRGARRAAALAALVALAAGSVGGLAAAMRWGEPWAGYRQRVERERERRGAELRQRELMAAASSLDRDVARIRRELSPERARAAVELIGFQLTRPGSRRNPERVAAARAKLAEMKASADSAVEGLSGPPTGVETLDRHRARAREFAVARSRSFALMLAMLDSPAVPGEAEWAEWAAATRAAEALWPQIAPQ